MSREAPLAHRGSWPRPQIPAPLGIFSRANPGYVFPAETYLGPHPEIKLAAR